jgi:hypothetical protein
MSICGIVTKYFRGSKLLTLQHNQQVFFLQKQNSKQQNLAYAGWSDSSKPNKIPGLTLCIG